MKLVKVLLIFGILVALPAFFFDKIIILFVDQFTEYDLSFRSLDIGLSGCGRMEQVSLSVKDKSTVINAGEILFFYSILDVLKNKKVDVDCEVKNVIIDHPLDRTKETTFFDNIIFRSFSPENKHNKVLFKFTVDEERVKISNFKADSKDIRIMGEYTYFKNADQIEVLVEILLSPEFAGQFEENIRDNVLTVNDDGWYGTVIDYQGNPDFLLAVYALTV
ncbi:MAG: hypothetical protein KAI70_05805 [Candidatus Omnitrophica bacterium]|nr:hypothetical protein [Candidatus Omnitrophota bacterium]